MNEEFFQTYIQPKLEAFRAWNQGRELKDCRLVQYCSIQYLGGIDISASTSEQQIEGVISEGFGVDWNEHQGKLYLMVWEPRGLEWTWPQVFAEEDLQDLAQFEPPAGWNG